MIALAVREGHVDLAGRDGRHAHERIAEPFLPHRFAVQGEDFQLATFGVESNEAFIDHGRRGSVVLSPVLPDLLAGDGIEGIKLMTAEAAADEDAPLDHGRSRQGAVPRNRHLPADDLAVLILERFRIGQFYCRWSSLWRILLKILSRHARSQQEGQKARQKRSSRKTPAVHGRLQSGQGKRRARGAGALFFYL